MYTVGSRILPQSVAAYLGRWAARVFRDSDLGR